MVYLHKDKEEFINAVNLASEYFHILPIIVEKDYYVTMILRELSERQGFVVFKGGTSLSKCHKAIKRFSEDIDITIDSKLSQGQMKKLKEVVGWIIYTVIVSPIPAPIIKIPALNTAKERMASTSPTPIIPTA